MDAADPQFCVSPHPLDQAQGFAVIGIEAELRPHRMGSGIHMDADAHRQSAGACFGEAGQREHLIAIVHLDHGAFGHGGLQCRGILPRTVEDDARARDPVVAGLFILETRYHFRDRTFLMEQPADRIEIIRLVGPGETHLRVNRLERLAGLADLLAQLAFRKYKQRAAMFGNQFGHRHAVDHVHHRQPAVALGIGGSLGNAPDRGWTVGFFFHEARDWGWLGSQEPPSSADNWLISPVTST